MIEADRKCDQCRAVIRPGARFLSVQGNVIALREGQDHFDGVSPDGIGEVCGIDCAVQWFYKKIMEAA